MSKKILPSERPDPKRLLAREEIQRGLHPVQLALSKAEACRQLLRGLDAGEIPLDSENTLAWVFSIALDTLGAALEEAGTEFLKFTGETADKEAAA